MQGGTQVPAMQTQIQSENLANKQQSLTVWISVTNSMINLLGVNGQKTFVGVSQMSP